MGRRRFRLKIIGLTYSKFKQQFLKAKEKSGSKRKSFVFGFISVLTLFGTAKFIQVLPAVAEELPSIKPETPTTNQVSPPPDPQPAPSQVPSEQIIHGLSGAAATVCALAINSGSFAVGIACGVIVVIGILKIQGK